MSFLAGLFLGILVGFLVGAWATIESKSKEIKELEKWQKDAFKCYNNIDLDIARIRNNDSN